MIFARDKGRMCNNILQYGHVYAWGREYGKATMSMRFAYKYPYFHICHTKYHNFPLYVIVKYLAKWKIIKTVSFNEPQDEKDVSKRLQAVKNSHFIVEGWYIRVYNLFLKYKEEILQLFAIDKKVTDSIKLYIESTSDISDIRIGIHIRRGDYISWNNGRYYFSDEVYAGYISHFIASQTNKSIAIYICSNDPKLNKNYYKDRFGSHKVNFPNGKPVEDLCLLSNCHYIIGVPSTFSLVAAMYHDTPLCWIEDSDATVMRFDTFDNLFRNIH